MTQTVEIKVPFLLTTQDGKNSDTFPVGTTLEITDAGDGMYWIEKATYPDGKTMRLHIPGNAMRSVVATYGEVHKHCKHAFEMVDTCPLCDGTGERDMHGYGKMAPCRNCNGKGYNGRRYKANA